MTACLGSNTSEAPQSTGYPQSPSSISWLVDTLPAASIVDPLETAGYELRAENDDRLFFAKGPEDDRTHYLHVAETRSEYATEMVVFRDHLRENQTQRRRTRT